MLRANHAVRLGLRAASRNPELAFGKALIDQVGNFLSLLPLALGALLVATVLRGGPLRAALAGLRALLAVRWPVAGAMLAALAAGFAASMFFWAGAVPLLAADAELNRRPPPGNFAVLLSRGAARTTVAGALGWGASLTFTFSCYAVLLLAAFAAFFRPSAGAFAGAAFAGAAILIGSVLLDALARLTVVRAAAFGDSGTAAFAKAASFLGARLGACATVTVAFIFLELIVAAVAGTLVGLLPVAFSPPEALMALAPRAAVALATGAVLAWLEVGRMGALAALVADAEGLIEPQAPPEPPPVAELVVEALPADDVI